MVVIIFFPSIFSLVAATSGRVHKIVHHKDYAHYKWKFSMANNTSSINEIQFMSMCAIKEIMGSQFRIIKVQGCCDRTKVKSNIFKRGSDFPATSERASNYRSTDKPIKMDDGHSALNADMQTKLVSGRVLTLKNQRGEVVPSVLEICPLLRIDKLASCLCKACHHCSLDKVIFSPFLRSCLCTSVQEFQVLLHCFTWLNSPSCKFCNSCG